LFNLSDGFWWLLKIQPFSCSIIHFLNFCFSQVTQCWVWKFKNVSLFQLVVLRFSHFRSGYSSNHTYTANSLDKLPFNKISFLIFNKYTHSVSISLVKIYLSCSINHLKFCFQTSLIDSWVGMQCFGLPVPSIIKRHQIESFWRPFLLPSYCAFHISFCTKSHDGSAISMHNMFQPAMRALFSTMLICVELLCSPIQTLVQKAQ